jgi:ABC-type taurine transport system substrate-binding protein
MVHCTVAIWQRSDIRSIYVDDSALGSLAQFWASARVVDREQSN